MKVDRTKLHQAFNCVDRHACDYSNAGVPDEADALFYAADILEAILESRLGLAVVIEELPPEEAQVHRISG